MVDGPYPALLPIVVKKGHDQKQLWEARVYLAYASQSQSITSQGRNSRGVEGEAETIEEHCFRDCPP